MKRVLIFGASDDTLSMLDNNRLSIISEEINIVAIADNDSRLKGKDLEGIPIIQPLDITNYEFDTLIVTPVFFEEIKTQLLEIGVESKKIIPYYPNYRQFFDKKKRSFGNVQIGKYSYFKPGTKILNAEIGSFCHIGTNCIIGQAGHDPAKVTTYPLRYHFANLINDCSQDRTANRKRINKTTKIGNDVYIGEGVVIFAGVTVGSGSVIASKAVVSKDVEEYSIVGGIPARVIAQRFTGDQIDRLREISWWNWSEEKIAAHLEHLEMEVEEFLHQARIKQIP